jgi:hypothetical protein
VVVADFPDFSLYLRHVYGVFERDFIRTQPFFRGRRVLVDARLGPDGRAEGFWHLVSRDPKDPALTRDDGFDGARCERIAWPRSVIENAADPQRVRCWCEGEGRKRKWRLALPDFSYVVVLADRGPKYFILTAFPPDMWTRYPEKLRSSYEAYVLRAQK